MGQRRQSNLMNLQLRSFAMSYIPPFFIQFLCTSALFRTMFIRPAAAPCQHAIHDCQRQQGSSLGEVVSPSAACICDGTQGWVCRVPPETRCTAVYTEWAGHARRRRRCARSAAPPRQAHSVETQPGGSLLLSPGQQPQKVSASLGSLSLPTARAGAACPCDEGQPGLSASAGCLTFGAPCATYLQAPNAPHAASIEDELPAGLAAGAATRPAATVGAAHSVHQMQC